MRTHNKHAPASAVTYHDLSRPRSDKTPARHGTFRSRPSEARAGRRVSRGSPADRLRDGLHGDDLRIIHPSRTSRSPPRRYPPARRQMRGPG
jgi:hypothetical protein